MARIPAIEQDYLCKKLGDLLHTPSPSGYTDEIVRQCCAELSKLGIPFQLTRRGAIQAHIKGKKHSPGRAIIAHLDTLGAQVKALKPNGRLELVPIGHWSSRFAEGARVTLFTRHGSYRGSILPLKASGHTFNKEIDTQPVSWGNVELRVDARVFNIADLEERGIAIGDYVAIDPQPEFLDNGFIVSRHLDDKAGVAVMLAALKSLIKAEVKLPVDTYFLFSIAEEVGVGASNILHGDIASLLAIDNGTTAPGQNSQEFGATIAMADQSGPFDYHLTHKLIDLAEEHRIPYQRDIFRYYRCDAASAVEAGNDIRAALITFGVDASHGYERIHVSALTSLAKLVNAYVLSDVEITRDEKKLSGLKGFTHQPMDEAEQDGN